MSDKLEHTVEPPNKEHFGSRHFVLYRETVFIERLSFGGRLNNTTNGAMESVPYERLFSGGRIHYQRFHCIYTAVLNTACIRIEHVSG